MVEGRASTLLPMASSKRALGRTIARLRKRAGYSQEGFAVKSRVHRTYMSELERGVTNPSLDVLERVARSLGLRMSELFREAESERDKV